MNHWAAKYVGIPYEAGARGPVNYDCWGIIQLIYQQEKGIVLPELAGLSAEKLAEIHNAIVVESQSWIDVAVPTEGCVVCMSTGSIMHHVGVFIESNGGRVLHSKPGHNVIVETPRSLKLRGLRILKYYQHHLWPGSLNQETHSSP